MKKLSFYIILVVLFLCIMNVSSYAQSIDEMRENGTLLLVLAVSIFGGFYLFGVILVFVAGATERKLEGKKYKKSTRKRRTTPKPTATYSLPYAQSFISTKQLKRKKRRA